jgi:hypothetical protein
VLITKEKPTIKTNYKKLAIKTIYIKKKKKKKNQKTNNGIPSTSLYQTTPEKEHFSKSTAGGIVHKQWNMINKGCCRHLERHPTRPAKADLCRKAIRGQGRYPIRLVEKCPSRKVASEVVRGREVTFSLNARHGKHHQICGV